MGNTLCLTASMNMMCHMRQVQPLTCRSTSLPCSTALASLVSQGAVGATNTGMATREHTTPAKVRSHQLLLNSCYCGVQLVVLEVLLACAQVA